VNFTRATSWFYRSNEGNLVLLPYKVNRAIGEALCLKKSVLSVTATERTQYFWYKTTKKYNIDFATGHIAIVVDNNPALHFSILNELDLQKICYWNPFASVYEGRTNVTKIGKKPLSNSSAEWKTVADMFHCTVPMIDKKTKEEINNIVKITKLYHPGNKKLFDDSKTNILQSHQDNPLLSFMSITKLLWHGTGALNPDVIFNFEGNFAPNYASIGLWGTGCYFASDAAYSANYAYTAPNGNKIMLLCEVLVGQGIQCLETNTIVDVPHPHVSSKNHGGYNSVIGYRHGSWIYIVYRDTRALPIYEVEFEPIK